MSGDFLAAHGATLEIEIVTDIGSGTFTRVGLVDSNIAMGYVRATQNYSPHDLQVMEHFVSPVMDKEGLDIEGCFDPSEGTHDSTTGLQAHFLGTVIVGVANIFAVRLSGRGATPPADTLVASCQLSAFNQMNEVDANCRRFRATLQFKGAMIIDGTTYEATA